MITCTIPGKPIPCSRPHVTVKGVYYKKAYSDWKRDAAVLLRDAVVRQNGGRPLEGPLSVSVAFYGANAAADLDNLVKAVLDAAELGGAFKNDRQVTHLEAWRRDPVEGPTCDVTMKELSK